MAYPGIASFSMSKLRPKIDYGVIYLCGQCGLPVGDTSDWSDNHFDTVLLLKAVSPFVKSGKAKKSTDPHDAGSRYKPLSCSECCHVLGKFYTSTPEHLSYKCNLYNIDIAAIDRYTFRDNLQRFSSTSEAPITLEMCHYYDVEITKQKVLLDILHRRLSKLEESMASEEGSLSVQDDSSASI